MPTVETTITVSIPEDGMSLEQLEQAIAAGTQQAGRELLVAGCAAIERQALEGAGDTLRRDKRRSIDLLTGYGWIKLERWQMREVKSGRYGMPLDQVLGLGKGQHASPRVLVHAVSLATRLPYRQATLMLGDWIGEELDHRALYRWVQKEGVKVIEEEDEAHAATFEHGEIPERDPTVREVVVTEVDGTFLKAQGEGADSFELRLGVLASGKQLVSASARHQRYRLKERVLYGGVESASAFGERLFLAGEAALGLSQARHLLLVGDGADWIEALAGHDRWKATYQLDWWHLKKALRETFPDHPELVDELQAALRSGAADQLLRLVALARIKGVGDPDKVTRLEGYLQTNRAGFYGAQKLRAQLSDEAKLVAVVGSGAVEKQMDLVAGRRFKGQGMRWSKRGANRLLKLRLHELQRTEVQPRAAAAA